MLVTFARDPGCRLKACPTRCIRPSLLPKSYPEIPANALCSDRGESGAVRAASRQIMRLFTRRAFIAAIDPILMGFNLWSQVHGRQDELPRIVYRAGHAV